MRVYYFCLIRIILFRHLGATESSLRKKSEAFSIPDSQETPSCPMTGVLRLSSTNQATTSNLYRRKKYWIENQVSRMLASMPSNRKWQGTWLYLEDPTGDLGEREENRLPRKRQINTGRVRLYQLGSNSNLSSDITYDIGGVVI